MCKGANTVCGVNHRPLPVDVPAPAIHSDISEKNALATISVPAANQRDGDFAAATGRVLDVQRRPCHPARPMVCKDESPGTVYR